MSNSQSQSATSSLANGTITVIATNFEKQTEHVDLRALRSFSAPSLKACDPFTYYSIPMLKNAAVLNKEDDVASFQVGNSVTGTVTRKTAISAECHPDLIFMNHTDEDDDTEEYDFLSAAVEAKRNTMAASSA
jgi:hypothetical protein